MTRPDLPPALPPERALEVSLYAEDLDACADFYARVIGLERGPAVKGRQ